MSLPPGFLDELRTHLSLSQVVGRKVMWDNKKSQPGKGDMWSPCPFHQEKTASFHVDDKKGFYYCFGCHAKGDAISFVRETENVSFMEAVEILAGEAGLTMPAKDPRAQEKADRRTLLSDVMEQAVQWFRLQLKTGAARDARDYLAGRGLDEQARNRWEIGFAPDNWQGLWDHLRGKNIDENLILGAGLAKPSTKGGKPYDTFRGRIMFPIRDARGRAIAFGGRAMDPNDNAKYLNSPETELFDKGRSLYNHAPAREAAGKGQPLIVAEGYMDVIALSEFGFHSTVAPLGTAITENQLRLMWRMSDEPIIALDGDTAGLRAAMRLIDNALPLLEAGKSLRFAMMPQGQDPDDVLRKNGAAAVQTLIDQAQPMVRLLWSRETSGKVLDSPERKAALDKVLREKIKTIQDPSIRSHYGEEIKRLRWELFNPRRSTPNKFGKKWQPKAAATAGARSSILAQGGDQDVLREAVILATLIANPDCLAEFEAQLETMDTSTPDHRDLRDALLDNAHRDDIREALFDQLGPIPLENLFGQPHVSIVPAVRRPGNQEVAQMCLGEEFAKLTARRGHEREIEEAIEEMRSGPAGEYVTARLAQSSAALNNSGHADDDDKAEFETGANGAKMNKEERTALDDLIRSLKMKR